MRNIKASLEILPINIIKGCNKNLLLRSRSIQFVQDMKKHRKCNTYGRPDPECGFDSCIDAGNDTLVIYGQYTVRAFLEDAKEMGYTVDLTADFDLDALDYDFPIECSRIFRTKEAKFKEEIEMLASMVKDAEGKGIEVPPSVKALMDLFSEKFITADPSTVKGIMAAGSKSIAPKIPGKPVTRTALLRPDMDPWDIYSIDDEEIFEAWDKAAKGRLDFKYKEKPIAVRLHVYVIDDEDPEEYSGTIYVEISTSEVDDYDILGLPPLVGLRLSSAGYEEVYESVIALKPKDTLQSFLNICKSLNLEVMECTGFDKDIYNMNVKEILAHGYMIDGGM